MHWIRAFEVLRPLVPSGYRLSVDIFISWSGARSKAVARDMAWWLERVLHVRPWMSEGGLTKGELWTTELLTKLHAADIGIVCLTPAAQRAPWVLFETGVLLKEHRKMLICTLLVDMTPSEVGSPFSLFQATCQFPRA